VGKDASECAMLRALLERWGCHVPLAADAATARMQARHGEAPDLVLLAQSVVDDDNVLPALVGRWGSTPPVVLLESARHATTEARARQEGVPLLPRALRPPALRALLSQLLLRASQATAKQDES